MTSSRDKGKRKLHVDQGSTNNYKLRFLKPVIRPSMFKLSLPITSDELPNRTPFLDLVVPDGRNNHFRCFWSPMQNGKIALTRGWQEFYQTYKIDLDFMLYFKHKGNSNFQVWIFDFGGIENSYQLRDPAKPPYVRTGNFQTTQCINILPSARAKAVADNRHPLILTHGHIEVEATYTRYSGKRDGSFGIISGGWENFASLCNFKAGGVGSSRFAFANDVICRTGDSEVDYSSLRTFHDDHCCVGNDFSIRTVAIVMKISQT
ncbi:hypothetical protein Ahy_A07g034867 [Arachis hypogaea]|uniref:TF-B3 domain-containing protein n=1 Tax=Arachis hypogaea TaxID=3818 RepID=A0A445CCX4_ARAHY|nr:hypothetical protein Ahy_A07g034867 [Arachis hypogaea]